MEDAFLLPCPVFPASSFCDHQATVDVLRLDLLHPIVSGNKWFKLKHYLAEASSPAKTVLTFGGAFSNHLLATAAAAKAANLPCIGIVRGEESARLSHTLIQAKELGMSLCFVSRSDYQKKLIPPAVYGQAAEQDLLVIPEGGYGKAGAKGAEDILLHYPTDGYTSIITAVGTGTTLAGLLNAARPEQQLFGIPVLKNALSLTAEIMSLLLPEKHSMLRLLPDYHFGGYAKHSPELIRFMNAFYTETGIPTDFVYTGKAFYAAFDLLEKGFFRPDEKILLLHTGGLQGNDSLPKGTLIFS